MAQDPAPGRASVSVYRRALRTTPGDPAAARALAILLHGQGRRLAARQALQDALAVLPRAETCLALAELCLAEGDAPGAVVACRQAVALAPSDPGPLVELAGALGSAGEHVAAEQAVRAALALRPGYPEARANLGVTLFNQGRLAEAAVAHRALLAEYPGHAPTWQNLASAERQAGDFAAARAAYAEAVRLQPEFAEGHRDLGLLDLLLGDLAGGFARYEWRLRAGGFSHQMAELPAWDGAPAPGRTVLLHYEQGFGDTIQCLRFVPLVAARGARVLLRVPRPLERLAESVPGVDRVIPDGAKMPRADAGAYLLSLPHLLGAERATLAAHIPYVTPPPERVAFWRARLDDETARRIGLVWSGNPKSGNDRQRSMPASFLAQLLAVPGCAFYSLNPAAEVPQGVRSLPERPRDFADTAAVMTQLNLVIAVDTAAAHLAGALGRPVWVLLPFVPDWRWRLDRADSDWYPSARLFRQGPRRDWGEVVAQVAAAL